MTKMPRRQFFATGAAIVTAAANRPSTAAPSEKKPIKIGQIGTGHAHAAGKMATLRKLPDQFEVVGIVEPDEARRTAVEGSSAYRDLPWLTEEQLLNTTGLKAVAVETAVPDLVPVASRCIDAGMHIHLDKPAGMSLSAFRSVLQRADRQGLAVQMGYMFRNNPAFKFCFQAVRERWIGEVFEIDAVMSKRISQRNRDALRKVPGGTMFELGCHLIDALVTLMGPPEKVTPFIRQTLGPRDDLADNMLAVLEYPKATCTVRSSVVEVAGTQRRQFVICGTGGTLVIRPLEPPKLQLALEQPRAGYRRGYQDVPLAPMPGRYDDQLIELAHIVRGAIKNPYPSSHDLAVHETILQASGMPVE